LKSSPRSRSIPSLHRVANWIIPKHIWEIVPVADWHSDPGSTGQDPARVVGSGAWKFQEWRQGKSVTLDRNDHYYQKVPYLDSDIIRTWPDQTAIVDAFFNGEIDAAAFEPCDVETVASNGKSPVSTGARLLSLVLTCCVVAPELMF
jgi:ABC-type transport system substrate-binding protein